MGCISLLHTTTLHLHYYNGGSISLLHTTTLHLHYYNRGSISLLHTTTLHLHYYNGGCISLLQEREGTPRANQYPRPPIKSCPPISRVFQHCPSTSSRPRIVSFRESSSNCILCYIIRGCLLCESHTKLSPPPSRMKTYFSALKLNVMNISQYD